MSKLVINFLCFFFLEQLITENVIQVELFSCVIQRQCFENCLRNLVETPIFMTFLCRVINLKSGVLYNMEFIIVYLWFYDIFTVKVAIFNFILLYLIFSVI